MKVLLALLLAATLAGCTTPDDEFVTPDQDDEGRYVIKMLSSSQLSPAKAEVPVGATVVWINEGGAHNVREANNLFSSEVSPANGEHLEYTFDEAGDYEYWCEPHKSAGMEGTIRVAE